MGHSRLGSIPKSKRWTEVIHTITSTQNKSGSILLMPAQISEIAKKTLDAADTGLSMGVKDIGLQYSFYLLTQISLSSRANDWETKLKNLGIDLKGATTAIEFGRQIQTLVDNYIINNGKTTDISEMAQKALGSTFATLLNGEVQSLFQSNKFELRRALHKYSTKDGFSELGQTFFGNFMSQFLNFYLSRITSAYTDSKSIGQIGNISEFNKLLSSHCKQSAYIVRNFSGEWYSKTEYLEGIDQHNSRRFVAIAIKKLQSELKKQKVDL